MLFTIYVRFMQLVNTKLCFYVVYSSILKMPSYKMLQHSFQLPILLQKNIGNVLSNHAISGRRCPLIDPSNGSLRFCFSKYLTDSSFLIVAINKLLHFTLLTVTESADFGFNPILRCPQGPQGCLEKRNCPLSLNLAVWCAKIGSKTQKL